MKFADGGTGPAYNVQVSTDAVHSLIVGIDVSHAGSDYQQLAPAVDRLERTTGDVPDQMVVDGGYISSENVLKMAERGVDLIGPESEAKAFEANQQKSYDSRGVKPAYETSRFGYHAESDTYICPEGERLTRDARYEVDGKMLYRYRTAAGACDRCWAKAMCCPRSRHGRSVERREELPAIAAFREKMQTDEARAVYRTRSQVAEFPNLWIKAKLGLRQFRLRGLVKVGLEALWCALTYDIQRAIRLLGQRRRFGAVSP